MADNKGARVLATLSLVIGATIIVGCDDTPPDEPIDAGSDGDVSVDADRDENDDADRRGDGDILSDGDRSSPDVDEFVPECVDDEYQCVDGVARLCSEGMFADLARCPLGCDPISRECRVPSNIPAHYLELITPELSDLVLTGEEEMLIDTVTGAIISGEEVIRGPVYGYDPSTGTTFIQMFQDPRRPKIGVFVVSDLVIDDGATVRAEGDNALVFLASGEVLIDGLLTAAARGQLPGPGGWAGGRSDESGQGGCGGHTGASRADGDSCASGAGGGGHGGSGGVGGPSACPEGEIEGGEAGASECCPEDIRPLRGGSGGGGGSVISELEGSIAGPGAGGGGGIQITAVEQIVVGVTGAIDASGSGGAGADMASGAGGGAGGAIMLEAPVVHVVDGAVIAANGGGGGGGDDQFPDGVIGGDGQPGQLGSEPAMGGEGPGELAGAGGPGGAGDILNGGDAVSAQYAGGGGGGAGRIRINALEPPVIDGVLSPALIEGGATVGSLLTVQNVLPMTGSEEIDGTTYAYHVPTCAQGGGPSPVLYAFHGSGGSGAGIGSRWLDVSNAFCFIIVAQDSGDSRGWGFVDDGSAFVSVIGHSDGLFDIDADRRYVHGYSAGAHWIYGFGLYNSDFFAGLAVYAGSLYAAIDDGIWPDATGDPMPIFIAHGTDDSVVPYNEALLARDEFENAGWPVRLWTAEGGTHAYEPAHQWEAWAFWDENVD